MGNESESKKCKGIRNNVVKKHITHDDYKNCLVNREEQMRKMNVIRSHLHDVYTGWRGGLVVGRRTCDLVVAGSRPGRDAAA